MSTILNEEIHGLQGAIALRPNGKRVLRMLREALALDGKLSSRLRGASGWSVAAAALAVAGPLLTVILSGAPRVQGIQVEVPEIPALDPVQAHMQPTPAMELTYQNWLQQQHERVSHQGGSPSPSATF